MQSEKAFINLGTITLEDLSNPNHPINDWSLLNIDLGINSLLLPPLSTTNYGLFDSFGQIPSSESSYTTSPADSYRNIKSISTSKNDQIDAVLGEYSWANKSGDSDLKTTITYSFANLTTSRFSADYSKENEYTSMQEFSYSNKALVKEVLASISSVCQINFVEVSETPTQCGVIRYAFTDKTADAGGWAYMPGTAPACGDIWISLDLLNSQNLSSGFYLKTAILHETLHALGLKHPFEAVAPFYKTLTEAFDVIPYTVMSYNEVKGNKNDFLAIYPQEPMYLDVAALQYIYGLAQNNSGDTVYDLSKPEFKTWRVIHDSGGMDTLDASKVQSPVKLNLKPGSSDIGVDIRTLSGQYNNTLNIAYKTVIERAIGSPYSDEINGSPGANTITGLGGNDSIDGGNGIDTAVYQGRRSEYSVTKLSTGQINVRDLVGSRDGSDTLTNIERVRFTDAALAFDTDLSSGQVYRIYKAAFNRDPMQGDKVGLGYWISRADSGIAIVDIAAGFVSSNEFKALYGVAPTNSQFLTKIYQNVLGRQPEAAGYNWWLGEMNNNQEKTKAKVLADFAESAENKAGVLGLIGSGITYEPWLG